MRTGRAGYTLLELLIVLAIATTLATLGLASYDRSIVAAHRSEARATLLALASAQERHYLDHSRYAARFGGDGGDAALAFDPQSASGWYAISILAGDRTEFRAEARAQGTQRRDHDCAVFVLESSGRREALDSDGADATARCWG